MRYFVTDTLQDINATDGLVITNRYVWGRNLEKKHVPVYCISENEAYRSYGNVEKNLDVLINGHMNQIVEPDKRILWNFIPDAVDGVLGISCKKAVTAVDEWMKLIERKPTEIIFQISSSNRIFCIVGKLIAEKEGIPVHVTYASWEERIRGQKSRYSCLQKVYSNLIRYRNIFKLIHQSKVEKIRGGGCRYRHGIVFASDAIRIYLWTIPAVKLALKTLGTDTVRVLCVDCDKTYLRLKSEKIPCDKLTDWFDKRIVRKEEKEYKTYRKKLCKYMHKNLTYSYKGIDLTQMILAFFDQYLWAEKADHYRLKMIYQSYFSRNTFWCIEPWSTTRYYQTNICCLLSNGAKHCRVNGTPAFGKPDSFREVYPDFWDFIFFPKVGFDLREECYEPNQWGKERFYASIRYSDFMQEWNKIRQKNNYSGIKNIALLPGNTYEERNIMETDEILDCLKEFHVVCKFHPNSASHTSILEYMNRPRPGVTFVPPGENIANVIEKADIVITMFSMSMLDAMAAHKLCIVITNEEERKLASYMEPYLNFWSVSQLRDMLPKIAADTESCKSWYQQQLKRQDAFFEGDEALEDPYMQLKRIYEAQKQGK